VPSPRWVLDSAHAKKLYMDEHIMTGLPWRGVLSEERSIGCCAAEATDHSLTRTCHRVLGFYGCGNEHRCRQKWREPKTCW
jgi:hypothetical protein